MPAPAVAEVIVVVSILHISASARARPASANDIALRQNERISSDDTLIAPLLEPQPDMERLPQYE